MKKTYPLDQEEQELLRLFEEGRLSSTKNSSQDKVLAKRTAAQHNKKDKRINIRISQFDLDRIKRLAAKEGLPYQILISSVLHRYAEEYLQNTRSAL